MIQRLTTAAVFLALVASLAPAQTNPFPKFKPFMGAAPGVDFFASQKSEIDPFIKPIADARQKIEGMLGADAAKGAIFVCSTLAQKDSIYDQRIFKLGYKWYLVQLTPEAQRQERMARMQAAAASAGDQPSQDGRQSQNGRQGQSGTQSGRGGQGARGDQAAQAARFLGNPAQGGRQGGGQNPAAMQAAAEARAAATLASQVGYAILMTSLNNDKSFRISRLDDMSRTPLNDWLDIALVAYATGNSQNSYRTMQERIDDTFPLDDMLSMSRPFVAQGDTSGGGGGGAQSGGDMGATRMGGAGQGGAQSSGRQGGAQAGGGQTGGRGGSRVLPKDQLDRLVFDAQSIAFFSYLMEKSGPEKVKDLIQQNLKKVETLQVVMNLLGNNIDKVEAEWHTWVQAQKPAGNPGRGSGPAAGSR